MSGKRLEANCHNPIMQKQIITQRDFQKVRPEDRPYWGLMEACPSGHHCSTEGCQSDATCQLSYFPYARVFTTKYACNTHRIWIDAWFDDQRAARAKKRRADGLPVSPKRLATPEGEIQFCGNVPPEVIVIDE